MLFSGWVNHFRNSTQARIWASVPLVTIMPAPCWAATGLQPAKDGQGRMAGSMAWLSASLVITWAGKKGLLADEPT